MSGKVLSEKRKLQLSNAVSIYDIHERAMARWNEWGKTDRYSSGFPLFDKYLSGGFGQKTGYELVVAAGESKIGKSKFIANIAMHIAQTGEKICYIPLENDYEEIYNMVARVAGVRTLIDYKDLIYFPDEELVNGDEGWDLEDLLLLMEQMYAARGTKVFVLDHLNYLFENEEQVLNEVRRVRVIMKHLATFCKRNKVTMFAVSHMNKGDSKIQGKVEKPNINRVYGSKGVTDVATKVLLLHEGEACMTAGGKKRRMVEVKLERSRHTANQDEWFAFDATEDQWTEEGVKLI